MKWVVDTPEGLALHINVLSKINAEGVLSFSPTDLRILMMETSGNAGVSMKYSLKGDATTNIGINMIEFAKVLKAHKGETTIELVENQLQISSKGRKHTLATYETQGIKTIPREIPPGRCTFTLPSKEYEKLIDDVTIFGTIVEYISDGNSVVIKGHDPNAIYKGSSMVTIEAITEKGSALNETAYQSVLKPLYKHYERVTVAFQDAYPVVVLLVGDDSYVKHYTAERVRT